MRFLLGETVTTSAVATRVPAGLRPFDGRPHRPGYSPRPGTARLRVHAPRAGYRPTRRDEAVPGPPVQCPRRVASATFALLPTSTTARVRSRTSSCSKPTP